MSCLRPIKHLRWWIVGLLAIATSLNYLDRQSFPVVVGEVRKEIPISNEQYGRLTSLFLLAYAIMYAGGGRLIDRLGTRLGYTVMIVWWSAATLLTGTAMSVAGIGVFRFLLGMGEGGGFPCSGKAVAEWFPAKERSMAFGIFNTGSAIGAVIAPPLIAWVVIHLGWRGVFYLTGGAGFVWAAIWWRLYAPPANHPRLADDERAHIVGALERPAELPASVAPAVSWWRLFTYRQVLGLMAAKFLSDAAWFFFIFWLPKYLGDVRHLNIREIGVFAWIPFAFAGLGSLTGGWLGTFLIGRHVPLSAARKITLVLGACLVPASLFVVAAPLGAAIIFFSLAMFAHQFWSANMQTLPADLFPSRLVGSVEGLLGSAGAFGGMVFGLVVGWLVERNGYGPAFVIAGALHPIALLVVLATVRRVEPVVR